MPGGAPCDSSPWPVARAADHRFLLAHVQPEMTAPEQFLLARSQSHNDCFSTSRGAAALLSGGRCDGRLAGPLGARGIGVLAAVARGDQHERRGSRRRRRSRRRRGTRGRSPWSARRRRCGRRPCSRSCVRLLATVARIARPSAPPTCWEVLIRPEASPASCGRGAGDRGDRHGHEREPEPDRGEQRRAEHVGDEGAAGAGHSARTRTAPPAINSMPGDQRRA